MNILVTGGAGFVGSNFVNEALKRGNMVRAIDNLSKGKISNLSNFESNKLFSFVKADLLIDDLSKYLDKIDLVIHFAGNPDSRLGLKDPNVDFLSNTTATSNLLEAMRKNNVTKIAFASTCTIYGDHLDIPTREDSAFPIQTSTYAASKLACEGMIQAYCEQFDFQSWIFRFSTMLGRGNCKTHVFDFYNKLQKDNSRLSVFGNGKQEKNFINVRDSIDAVFSAIIHGVEKVNIYNVCTNEVSTIRDSLKIIIGKMKIDPVLEFSKGDKGFKGDIATRIQDNSRIINTGWTPKYSFSETVSENIDYLIELSDD